MTNILLHTMPLTYHSLVVENTTRCNARCAMCYQSAGPKGSDTWSMQTLPESAIQRALVEAIQLPTLNRRFHLAGGESFLDIGQCARLFATARDSGFHDVSTTTNAHWAATPKRASSIAHDMREAGLLRMEISWDVWHRPYIKPEWIANCLSACSDVGIHTHLRLLTTKSHSAAEALRDISPEALDRIDEITSGVVFPTGRASTTIDSMEFYSNDSCEGACHSVLNLTVNAKGDVFPCCAGFDQTDYLHFGNIREKSIVEIAEEMNGSLLLRCLVFEGPQKLIDLVNEIKPGMITARYSSICHACWSIFSQPEVVDVLQEIFDNLVHSAIDEAADALRQRSLNA